MNVSYVGQSVKPFEDPRLLVGKGSFVDDMRLPDMLYAVEVRRRNFIPPDAFPYTTATGLTCDSGDFQPAFARALELGEYDGFRRQQAARSPGEPLIGVGVATVVKASGGRGDMLTSTARVVVEPTGLVQVHRSIPPRPGDRDHLRPDRGR